MPTADDKTLADAAPRETTDPNYPPRRTQRLEPADATTVVSPAPPANDLERTVADPAPPQHEPPSNEAAPTADPADRLLEALSRRQRPDRPGAAVAESSGAVAAAYYGNHEIHEATKTPAPLPSIVVTRTAEMPTVPGARLQAYDAAPVQTPASFAPAPVPAPRQLEATVIPGRRSPIGPFVAVAVVIAVLLIAGALLYRGLGSLAGPPRPSPSAAPVAPTPPPVVPSTASAAAQTEAVPAPPASASTPSAPAPVALVPVAPGTAAPSSSPSATVRTVATEAAPPRSAASPPTPVRSKPAPRPATTSDDLIEHPW